ncbi:MAG TPA: 5'-nucleotidase C-terminal domain-containing protein [Flavobacterium sp.]|nr:5'-nucleotidase C-terminal domain-containing protein [Flavobacterium sp.]
MTKLINNHSKFRFFIVLLTVFLFVGCASPKQYVSEIKGKQILIDQTISTNQDLENHIKPYRDHINQDLDSVLSYAPEAMDKFQGKWQSTISNFLGDLTLAKADQLLRETDSIKVDICLMNFGGIRAPINQGDVTARTAYQIMPFENSLVVAELKAEKIIELVNYFISEGKAHPIAGIEIELSEDQKTYKSIKIGGQHFDPKKTYTVATSDYLLTGGDRMNFFLNPINTYDLNYKLRNLIIDYFKDHKIINAVIDNRIH